MTAKHQPKRVVYVDREGRHLQARTLGEPDAEGLTLLLVGNGRGGMSQVEAPESGAKAAGTWHHPDQPS
jgi:hypothetical protein